MAVDWNKPLVVNNFLNKEVKLVGSTLLGDKILETKNGTLFKASAHSGRILDNRDFYVTNRVEPWEEAWKTFDQNPMYLSEKEYFKKIFELGRSWDK